MTSAPSRVSHAAYASYVEDVSPGSGALAPRAWYAESSAHSLSLNGRWHFRLAPEADTYDESFARCGYDAREWAQVAVPGHWVLQGHGRPIYTNQAYPFPVDPPRVPDAEPDGRLPADVRLARDG